MLKKNKKKRACHKGAVGGGKEDALTSLNFQRPAEVSTTLFELTQMHKGGAATEETFGICGINFERLDKRGG